MEAVTSTFALLEKAKTGDDGALSKLFEQYRRRLMVLVYFKLSAHLRERSEVEDVVQEVCLRAFRDVDRFTYRTPGSFLSWLSAITDHVIADRVRYRNRECRAGEEVPFRSESNPLGPEPVDSRTPSQLLSQQEAVDRLLARLSRLPEDYRDAILLAKIEGLLQHLQRSTVKNALGAPADGTIARRSSVQAPAQTPTTPFCGTCGVKSHFNAFLNAARQGATQFETGLEIIRQIG